MEEKRLRRYRRSSALAAFLRGMGGMLEFTRVLSRRNMSVSGANADYHALYADWEAVGGYFQRVFGDSSYWIDEAECPQTTDNNKKQPQE